MPSTFGIVDLFAGPGGLGEGFSALEIAGNAPFSIGVSIEKEISAHRTLTLRAFLREHRKQHGRLPPQFIDFHAGTIPEPDWSRLDPIAWQAATREALCLELGTPMASDAMTSRIRRLRRSFDETVLIGGPPCQAYSLVGRARAKGKKGYVPERDHRHYLFREYIRVLDQLRPAAFLMENVKGMLSSTVESRLVFEMLMEDLSSVGTRRGHLYELRAVKIEDGQARLMVPMEPADFIVRAEEFGVPQRRHRVIIVGIRSDIAAKIEGASVAISAKRPTVEAAIIKLPPIRSGLSRNDDHVIWQDTVVRAARRLATISKGGASQPLRHAFVSLAEEFKRGRLVSRKCSVLPKRYGKSNDQLLQWLERPELRAIAQHDTRGHMASDLERYLFAAVFAKQYEYSPKANEFPVELSPEHRNWNSGIFADRFRVQLSHEPSTTITSHISKDGHYFIHPDPAQVRSLTVREAARLQTFPDDYYFLGNRTQQYVQVGNAVPPFLAMHLASLVHAVLA